MVITSLGLLNINMAENGRPPTTDEKFKQWLEEMRPFLVLGCSLWRGIERAGLETHAFTIYEKYRLGDWFSQKIDRWRSLPGENINETMVMLSNKVMDKVKQEQKLDKEELDLLKHMSEKHRTAQPFFVTRTETAVSDPSQVGKILNTLEEKTDYDELGQQAEEQMVENDPPVQN